MKTFWATLPKPFLVQAPMDDVTDTVFRQIIAKCGKPDVFFTEFTNTDSLCSVGKTNAMKRLQSSSTEKPLIAQIWGNNPDHYAMAVSEIKDMGFAGIDINMGCPDRTVVKNGCCSGLIKNPELAKKIFLATRNAAGELPVSIKTRIGYSTIQTEDWITFLLKLSPDALIIHGRTTAELSKVPTHWDEIGKAVSIRNAMKSKTIIIGNGDIMSWQEANTKHLQYGVDGVMIGRGIFSNLWIFNKEKDVTIIPFEEKVALLIEHLRLFNNTWGTTKNFDIMKKFYKIYISDIPNATVIRTTLMSFKNAEETINFLLDLSITEVE